MFFCEDDEAAGPKPVNRELYIRYSVGFTFVRIASLLSLPISILSVKTHLENVDVEALGVSSFLIIIFRILSIVETTAVILMPIQEYLDYYSLLQSITSKMALLFYVLWFPIPYITLFFDAVQRKAGGKLIIPLDLSTAPGQILDFIFLHRQIFYWGLQWVLMYSLVFIVPELLRLYSSKIIRREFVVRQQEKEAQLQLNAAAREKREKQDTDRDTSTEIDRL
ncbi:hypothetical protein BDR26DRAFT_863766 [Obelidium mucronatum]|nr:hypothetical protein BDR26DRAFT_863766 [Obelidium mucronatum]